MNIYDSNVARIAEQQFTNISKLHKSKHEIVCTDGIRWLLQETFNCPWLIEKIAISSRKYKGKEDHLIIKIFSPSQSKVRLIITNSNHIILEAIDIDFDSINLFVDAEELMAAGREPCIRCFLVHNIKVDDYAFMLASEY